MATKKKVGAVSAPETEETPKATVPFEDQLVTFDNAVDLKINGQVFPRGRITCPRHVARTLRPMAAAKMKTDLGSLIGKSYLVEKINGNLIIKETGEA